MHLLHGPGEKSPQVVECMVVIFANLLVCRFAITNRSLIMMVPSINAAFTRTSSGVRGRKSRNRKIRTFFIQNRQISQKKVYMAVVKSDFTIYCSLSGRKPQKVLVITEKLKCKIFCAPQKPVSALIRWASDPRKSFFLTPMAKTRWLHHPFSLAVYQPETKTGEVMCQLIAF